MIWFIKDNTHFNEYFKITFINGRHELEYIDTWNNETNLKVLVREEKESLFSLSVLKKYAEREDEKRERKEKEKIVKKYNYAELHKKLQDILLREKKVKQIKIQEKYSFLCNFYDLESKLKKVILKYGITDMDKVEKVLIRYVEECCKKNFSYVQLVEYYIEKSGVSKFYSDYENFEEKIEIPKTKIDDVKKLF